MADTLGSVGVIISTLLIQFYGWTGFDPIASLFIAVLIAASVIPLVLDTGMILALDIDKRDVMIQKALSEVCRTVPTVQVVFVLMVVVVGGQITSIAGVQSYTNPRFWPKDSTTLIGSIHVQLAPSAASRGDPTGPHRSVKMTFGNVERVVERVKEMLMERIQGLEEVVVQVEECVFVSAVVERTL
jgi:zinc transporter 5/7